MLETVKKWFRVDPLPEPPLDPDRQAAHDTYLAEYTTCQACGNSHRKIEACPRCAELRKEEQVVRDMKALLQSRIDAANQRHRDLDAWEQRLKMQEEELKKRKR